VFSFNIAFRRAPEAKWIGRPINSLSPVATCSDWARSSAG